MKYKVIIREKAEKQLNKLDNSIKLKIMRYIKQNLNETNNFDKIFDFKYLNFFFHKRRKNTK